MSKTARVLVVVAFVAVAATALIWVLSDRSYPVEAQQMLRKYLVVTHQAPVTISKARAGVPQEFLRQMSGASYGDGTYFATLHSFGGETSSRLAPYPPTQLWCVWLQPAGGTDARLVLVALHEDLYVARWIVHEPVDDSVVATVRCPIQG